jgi:GT2 family glycosyltransferase
MFLIGIPTLNRADLLNDALVKYESDFSDSEILVIDNGKQDIVKTNNSKIITPEINMGVAGSWNFLCKEIFKTHDYAVLLNDDVYLGYNSDVIKQVINKYPNTLIQSFVSWSVVIISKHLYNLVGEFDEIFYPAYYEDSDYLYRMKINHGIQQEVAAELNPEVVRISMTQEKSPDFVNASMQANRKRYIEKWGGLPLLESFTRAYNSSSIVRMFHHNPNYKI